MSWSDDELMQSWKDGLFSKLVFGEINESLQKREMELIGEETARLVEENRMLGGSPHGFYYKAELFVIAGAFGKEGIEVIDESLNEKAEFLKLNRIEVQQHTTYIAHLLGSLDRYAEENPSIYCANAPVGLMQLSDSLNRMDIFCRENDKEFYEQAKFHPEDKAKAPFFAHFNRVDDPINRFLFRRTAY